MSEEIYQNFFTFAYDPFEIFIIFLYVMIFFLNCFHSFVYNLYCYL